MVSEPDTLKAKLLLALRPWGRPTLLGLGFFFLFYLTFAAASLFDAMREERDQDIGRTLFVYAIGFGQWIVLFPLIFRYSRQNWFMDASILSKCMQSAFLLLVSLVILMAYLVVIAAPLYQQPPSVFLGDVRLVQWVWDLVLFYGVILIGYLSGVSARNRTAEIAASELARQLAQQKADLSSREAEYLRGRLGSHFVMNALSNLVGLMRLGHVRRAEEATILLSDILRSMTGGSVGDECISIADEIEDAQKYLAFQQIRFPDLKADYEVAAEAQKLEVPRQLLQPLLENVFKHGSRSGVANLCIAVETDERNLYLSVRNECESDAADTTSDGEGFQLTRLRLNMTYGPDAMVNRKVSDGWYIVAMTIPLRNREQHP